jgi:hypothetical protein
MGRTGMIVEEMERGRTDREKVIGFSVISDRSGSADMEITVRPSEFPPRDQR